MAREKQLVEQVCRCQDEFTERWHADVSATLESSDPILQLVLQQHRYNFDLWHEEDKAREPDANDQVIAQVKRNIDALNQQRNDTITAIDELLHNQWFAELRIDTSLPWNSETLGSIIDRLSIASLKVFHMQEQADRTDAGEEHRASCLQKVKKLAAQKNDLATSLELFLADILAGRKQNKLYHQFKMYNDPNLNPAIYSKSKS